MLVASPLLFASILAELQSLLAALDLIGLFAFLVLTSVFLIAVFIICYGFYVLTGRTFARANKIMWRYARKRISKLRKDYRHRFHRAGFTDATFQSALELAAVAWILSVLAVCSRPRSFAEASLLLVCTSVAVTANSVQGWRARNKRTGKGTLFKFVKIYYLPAIFLAAPFFTVGKIAEWLTRPVSGVKLLTLLAH